MTENFLQEISRYSVVVQKLEEPLISWHNSYLTLRSHRGIHIFETQQEVQSFEKKFTSIESFVDTSKSSPASYLFTPAVINEKLGNFRLQEMIVDPTLWPHNPHLVQESTCVIDFKWSPSGLEGSHGSVLAVLNNIGGVDLFTKNLKWHCVIRLSESFSSDFLSNLGEPSSFEELRTAVHQLASTAICWSASLNPDKSCYLATGQKNGDLIFWLVTSQYLNVTTTIFCCLEKVSNEVVSLKWIKLTDEQFLLVISDILGKIVLLKCEIKDSSIDILSVHDLWPHEDRMLTESIEYFTKDDKITIFCDKHRHLVGFLLDKDLQILDQYVNNINDYKVTDISTKNDIFYVTTVNCGIYEVKVVIEENNLKIYLTKKECKEISPTCELYGLDWSYNNVICALAVIDRKIHYRKECSKIDIVLTTSHNIESLTNILIKNPTKKLTYYWDVIELLRFKCMKLKQTPKIDYEELYENASSDIYNLKLYLILITICNNLLKTFSIKPTLKLPEDSVEIVKEEILVAHAEQQLFKFYNKSKEHQLNNFEIECYIGAKKFLECYFANNGKNINNVIDSKVLNIMKGDYDITCQSCDEKLSGFLCKYKHVNCYCTLTFTLIESESYLVCLWCKYTARLELYDQNPLCLFCDTDLKFVE